MLKIDTGKHIARVTLDRPDVHNAFNDELIKLLTQAFTDLGARDDIRVIVLAGNGKSFCAGADLNWMKRMVQYSHDQNVEDARALARMFLSIAKCPKPVIGRIHGAALGGGAGLAAACDIAVAVESGGRGRISAVRFHGGKARHPSGGDIAFCDRSHRHSTGA
jgi:methylglutaconyl-CoA hydratase